MGYCPKCGYPVDENAVYCKVCGTMQNIPGNGGRMNAPFGPGNSGRANAPFGSSPMPGASSNMQPDKAPSQKGGVVALIIVLAVLVTVLCIGISVILLIKNDRENAFGGIFADTQETSAAVTEPATMYVPETAAPETVAPTVPEVNHIHTSTAKVVDRTRQIYVGHSMVTASSCIVQEGYDNSGYMAFDGDETTSWQVNTNGSGIGDYVTVNFGKTRSIEQITLKLGNHRSRELFENNNVPRALDFIFDSGSYDNVLFAKSYDEVVVYFDRPIETSTVTIRIADIYSGLKYQDTVIAEISFIGR